LLSPVFTMNDLFPAAVRFFDRQVDWFVQTRDGAIEFAPPGPISVFPGSFDPLHSGHTTLAELAARQLERPVVYELSVSNVDKPDLSADVIARRLSQFRGQADVLVTRAPLFSRKAALFPGSVFVVGADTAARIVHPKYYEGDSAAMLRSLDVIRNHGCRFFVGGRLDRDGRFVELDAVEVPSEFLDLFTGVDQRTFRVDVSSSELRQLIAKLLP
jgi:cytidyltransferase-like protein